VKSRFSVEVCAIVIGASSLTCCHPPTPRIARVEVPPYAIVADDMVKDIVAAFDRAEQAIQVKDLDGLPDMIVTEQRLRVDWRSYLRTKATSS